MTTDPNQCSAGVWRIPMTATTCHCAGCAGMGMCDDGVPCGYGCGGTATTPWGTCDRCEDEATGRDEDEDDDWDN